MGFLNHSTNNIIIDATLTEKGREYLSKNDTNSFNVTHYSFGDDEVDYSTITKYGSLTGKEKIEKNTPIFEATTGQAVSLKYPLVTIQNDTQNPYFYMPQLISEDSSTDFISLTAFDNSLNSKQIILKTDIPNADTTFTLQDSLKDNRLDMFFDNRYIEVLSNSTNEVLESVSTNNENVSRSSMTPVSLNEDFIGQIRYSDIKIRVNSSLTTTAYTKYSVNGLIRTQIYFVGNNSTAKKVIPITITASV